MPKDCCYCTTSAQLVTQFCYQRNGSRMIIRCWEQWDSRRFMTKRKSGFANVLYAMLLRLSPILSYTIHLSPGCHLPPFQLHNRRLQLPRRIDLQMDSALLRCSRRAERHFLQSHSNILQPIDYHFSASMDNYILIVQILVV